MSSFLRSQSVLQSKTVIPCQNALTIADQRRVHATPVRFGKSILTLAILTVAVFVLETELFSICSRSSENRNSH